MKMAKRVLAIVLTVFMVVGTCAVAASAEETLQAQIDSGASTVYLAKSTQESVVINRDVTIDLQGNTLIGMPGKSAITIKGGNVTITNGEVQARFANVPSAEMLETVFTNSPCAVRVTGGELTVDGVRIIGSFTRVPTTKDYFVPTGSAIQSYNGVKVTLKRASLIGDYGVNNAVRQNNAGGLVTVEDAVIFAYTAAIKGAWSEANGSVVVDAADHVEDLLNEGIELDAYEQKAAHNLLDDRTLIVVKAPETLTELLGKETPTVTVTPGLAMAEVKADVLDYTWKNTSSTDCSYRLVPVGVTMPDGTVAALDSVEADYVTSDAKIRYRAEFKMGDEVRPYLTDLDNYIDLNWWGQQADAVYAKAMNNPDEKVNSYAEIVKLVSDLWYDVDHFGAEPIPGDPEENTFASLEQFQEIQQIFAKLGGAVAYNKAHDDGKRDFTMDDERFANYFNGDVDIPANGMYGILDRVQRLLDGIEAARGTSFTKTENWDDLAFFVYQNYEEVIDILSDLVRDEEGEDNDGLFVQILNMKNDELYGAVFEGAGLSDQIGLIEEYIGYAQTGLDAINEALENNDVQAVFDSLERNEDKLQYYAAKVVTVLNNYETYFDAEYMIDDTYIKTFFIDGDFELIPGIPGEKLTLTIFGSGTVTAQLGGITSPGVTSEGATWDFHNTFTLTAAAAEGFEFLFWSNVESNGNRILSTEKTFTYNTDLNQAIEAVFQAVDEPTVFFTNVSGNIAGQSWIDADGTASTADVPDAYVPGFAFENWAGESSKKISADSFNADTNPNLTKYFAGNSVFASPNAYYGPAGAVMKINPSSASYIVTPVYSTTGNYTVTFTHDGKTEKASAAFGATATVTAKDAGFSYWADENDNVVCLNPTFSYTITRAATFHVVTGADNVPGFRTWVDSAKKETGKTSFYVVRTSSAPIKTAGAVFSFTNTNPMIGAAGCQKATAKFNTADGTYILGIKDTTFGSNAKIYIKPFIEYESGPEYGTLFTYPN